MNGNYRKFIEVGIAVEVVEKKHQRTGLLTKGIVEKILTNSQFHPHGIKVMINNGVVGRVKKIID